MSELDQLLAEAAFQTHFKQQKEFLSVVFKDACVFTYNGGIFELTPEFLAGLQLRNNYNTDNKIWAIDRNQTCILIDNVDLFIEKATKIYNKALEEYGTAWNNMRTKRSVSALIK
jgi:hypothetical protein